MYRTKSALLIAFCLATAAPAVFAEAPTDGEQARERAEDAQRSKQHIEHHLNKGAESKLRRDVDRHREDMERARDRNELPKEEEGSDNDLDEDGVDGSR